MGNRPCVEVLDSEFIEEMRMRTSFTEEEILKMFQRFLQIDEDHNGIVTFNEFLNFPEFTFNPFLPRVIEIVDKDKDCHVSFRELLIALSVFAERTSMAEKMRFLFQLYDLDGDGVLSKNDLFQSLRRILGNQMDAQEIHRAVDRTFEECTLNNDGKITFGEFQRNLDPRDVGQKVTIRFQ